MLRLIILSVFVSEVPLQFFLVILIRLSKITEKSHNTYLCAATAATAAKNAGFVTFPPKAPPTRFEWHMILLDWTSKAEATNSYKSEFLGFYTGYLPKPITKMLRLSQLPIHKRNKETGSDSHLSATSANQV